MPLLEGVSPLSPSKADSHGPPLLPRRTSVQYSELAKAAIMSSAHSSTSQPASPISQLSRFTMNPPATTTNPISPTKVANGKQETTPTATSKLTPRYGAHLGASLTDTPAPSMPGSPQIFPRSGSVSGSATPKIRATTLDIPGLTRSKVSPDGRISERDVAAKLVIIMVGLPARGKSYLVKKIARYLNWSQHPTRIFNVGDRRRVAAGGGQTISEKPPPSIEGALRESVKSLNVTTGAPSGIVDHNDFLGPPAVSAETIVNGKPNPTNSTDGRTLRDPQNARRSHSPVRLEAPEPMDQSAEFFDPKNVKAKLIREQVAHETLDELLKFVLEQGGSVGILDATNHTQDRRMSLIKHIRERDENINILFLESRCHDKKLLEANMRLKLSGPDYKTKDPVVALEDFQQRVKQYEKTYQPLGDFEEENHVSYCSLIDVGRKLVSHQVLGFLSIQTVTYLMNFNLAPRQIWITRHGESMDNLNGKIGGDSSLSATGLKYARALTKFIGEQRAIWTHHQAEKMANIHFPPRPGDTTPPNPDFVRETDQERNFCVWTSMLKRSIETSQFFDEEEYDLKQMRMLDELNAGVMEGMTYEEIKVKYQDEYALRKADKLHYRYPGPGGEGYLDIINRLRNVIHEIERMTDHVLLVGHRSISRVLLAYFMGLKQEDISDLDVPLGVAYVLEPRPYGVDFKAFRWNPATDQFSHVSKYKLRRAIGES